MLETYMYSYVHVNPHARVLVDTLFNFIKKMIFLIFLDTKLTITMQITSLCFIGILCSKSN